MPANSEFKDLLSLFEKHKVRYMIVGGYAVMRYSEPRFTKDLGIWISTDESNAASVFSALKEFGAPLKDLAPEDFTDKTCFYQMGRPPLRIDVMMSIPGVEFEEAWADREYLSLEGIEIPFISRADLIVSKEAAGRPQDKIDAERLKESERLDHR